MLHFQPQILYIVPAFSRCQAADYPPDSCHNAVKERKTIFKNLGNVGKTSTYRCKCNISLKHAENSKEGEKIASDNVFSCDGYQQLLFRTVNTTAVYAAYTHINKNDPMQRVLSSTTNFRYKCHALTAPGTFPKHRIS